MAAITAILARYPEEVITQVTHPAMGLPRQKDWLPTIKEVYDACDAAYSPIVRKIVEGKQIAEQLAERKAEEEARQFRPSVEELKAKYGSNWGMKSLDKPPAASTFRAPTLDELVQFYRTNPERVARLLGENGE